MYRCGISATLVLGLMVLAPAPVSFCAMLANLPGDCAPSTPKSECEQMGMAQPTVELKAASNLSCCQVSKAPLPDASSKVVAPDARAELLFTQHVVLPPQPRLSLHQQSPQSLSPPDRQQLLCVFLI